MIIKQMARVWWTLTPSKDVELSGSYESLFLESVYRICYVIGLSRADRGVLYRLYASMVKLLLAGMVLSETLYLFKTSSSLDEMVSSLNIIVIQLITLWKYKTMADHKELYKKLAKSMESPYFDVSTERRMNILKYWHKRHNKYFQTLFKLGTCTLLAWITFPLVDDMDYNFMIDIYLPFNYTSPLRYKITYFFTSIPFTYSSYWVIMSEIIMQTHLHHLICQFAVLNDCFVNIIEDCAVGFGDSTISVLIKDKTFVDKYTKRLSELVKQHQYILNITKDMKTILSGPMLGQLTSTGVLICLVAYQATTSVTENIGKFLMSLLYLGYVMFTFYLVCASCEEITMQSRDIGQAAYFSKWESGICTVPGVKATFMMVIARCNKPLIFLAGGMYTLSLSSYTNLVKASYTAFTVLLRADHK